MAARKENLKALFTNSKTRIIIIVTAILLLIAVIIGFFKLRSVDVSPGGSTRVTNAPAIQSIPGALNPTAEYVKLQEAQNLQEAQTALKSGGSAIPTIVKTQTFGQGVEAVGPPPGEGGVGFSTLSREADEGSQRSEWLQALQNSNCDKNTVNQVMGEGAKLTDLKAACSCAELKDDGFKLADLQQVCSCKELKAAGVNAQDLKAEGYTAGQLRLCGFSACELRNAGYTAQEMKDGGFNDDELRGAGYPEGDIAKASGLPAGITIADVQKAGCQAAALTRLREAGVSANAIRRINGCSAAALKAAGFTAQDLKNAGFTAAELRQAGFTPQELRQAGYTARDLLNAGFTPQQLAQAGYTPEQISAAEADLPPGITPDEVKAAACNVSALQRERLAGISAKSIRQLAGCNAQALKAAGFSDADLANAGFTPQQITAAVPVDDNTIRSAACDPDKLRTLFNEGVSASKIRQLNGCSAAALRAAGYSPAALKAAGFSDADLINAGFTPAELAQAGITPADIIANGREGNCNVANLEAAHARGVSAATLRQTLGCSAAALKAAGYTASDLRAAGFTAAELKNAGFTAAQLKAAGFSARDLRDAGFSAADLKNLGFTAAQLKAAGFTASQLKDAGFTAAQLKEAGFSAAELKAAGFSAAQLKDAGFSAAQLKDAGFSAQDLKNAGFTANELQAAGYSDADLAAAGFAVPGSSVTGLGGPDIPAAPGSTINPLTPIPTIGGASTASNNQQLQEILKRQNQQMADQRYQQAIQQKTAGLLGVANQDLQTWQKVTLQNYIGGGGEPEKKSAVAPVLQTQTDTTTINSTQTTTTTVSSQRALIKTGDIVFAVLDTAVNSDEPGPILATVVSGKLKGAKLIGSFTLPSNAEKMVISFNTMSVPSAPKSTSISAYAVDPNTARTALASRVDHHYFLRYGSLFASSFLEGFGNAFQSANTSITIGGTGGGDNITVSNGIGRSALENAVIGLATLGKYWGQAAQQQFNTPITVYLCAGTPLGILFTQDLLSL